MVDPVPLTAAKIRAEFKQLVADGGRVLPAGEARGRPELLARYLPCCRIDLFEHRFYLCRPRKNPSVRFFVAYVVPPGSPPKIYPRIFYKDLSLVWRSASHLVATEDEFWIGKGAVRRFNKGGYEHEESVEQTTDLPLEMQDALEHLNHGQRRVVNDERALHLILKNGPAGRIEPYRDFTAPRESDPTRINGGRSIARFTKRNVPESLTFAKGFEPDFRRGLLSQARSSSRLYGGPIRRFRFASTNRRIQYLFLAAPRHVWIIPPQAMTKRLSTYGVRTVDVVADDDLFVPGYEYHYDEDGELVSQIPPGFVGEQTEFDPTRADASAWLDRLPVVRAFRRRFG